jgi:hypothetical protein
MTTCTFEGCERKPAYPDQSRCEDHRLRWVGPAEQTEPEWVRRRRTVGLPIKDYTGHAA